MRLPSRYNPRGCPVRRAAPSDLEWQIFPTAGIKLSDRVSLEVGYRWLDLDYATGDGNERFGYDVLTQGPIGGPAIRF